MAAGLAALGLAALGPAALGPAALASVRWRFRDGHMAAAFG